MIIVAIQIVEGFLFNAISVIWRNLSLILSHGCHLFLSILIMVLSHYLILLPSLFFLLSSPLFILLFEFLPHHLFLFVLFFPLFFLKLSLFLLLLLLISSRFTLSKRLPKLFCLFHEQQILLLLCPFLTELFGYLIKIFLLIFFNHLVL